MREQRKSRMKGGEMRKAIVIALGHKLEEFGSIIFFPNVPEELIAHKFALFCSALFVLPVE